jgi:two-component system phosphate regulon response regulator PhoB
VARAARILIVEDNETLRTLVAQALESNGYVAIAAESGEAALEVAHLAQPDLCLVDHVMPGMTGAEFIRFLRALADERLRSVPVIGLSAYERGREELVAAGAVAALGKPVAYEILIKVVRDTLGSAPSPDGRAPAASPGPASRASR